VLFLRIALPFEPSHGASLAVATYLPGTRRSPGAYLAGDMPSIGINNSSARGRPKSSIKFGTLAAGFGGRLLGAWAPGRQSPRRPRNAFRGSVEPMMQTNLVGA
jgi:hypothetical protein